MSPRIKPMPSLSFAVPHACAANTVWKPVPRGMGILPNLRGIMPQRRFDSAVSAIDLEIDQ